VHLPQLNAVTIPDGVDDAEVRSRLLNEFDLEIGAGLGDLAGKIWRIGLMGYASNRKNVMTCLAALEAVGLKAEGSAVAAAQKVYGA
jgi:alanine-glyoxylate transaminase/serine-glyoxylate transaminase/serine-pyruvate transaminase